MSKTYEEMTATCIRDAITSLAAAMDQTAGGYLKIASSDLDAAAKHVASARLRLERLAAVVDSER